MTLLENKLMLYILHDYGYPLITKEIEYCEVEFKFGISKAPS